MIEWDLPRRPASALLLTRVGVEHGLTAEACLAGTGLTVSALGDADRPVSARQELRVIRNLQDGLNDTERIALEAGARYHLTTHGLWGFAIASSATAAEAIALGLRYISLTWAFCRFTTVPTATGVRVVLDPDHLPADVRGFLTLREIASAVTVGSEVGIHDSALIGIGLRRTPPTSTAPYEAALRVVPRFDAETDYIELDAAALVRPLPQADAHTRATAEQQCRDLLERSRARAGLAGRIRACLAATPQQMPDVETLAARLHISARTLRRRLAAEGTSYRAVADEVRELLAEELLAAGGLSVEQIARRLGYSATPAFTAAFTRWKGVSPRSYRNARG